MEKLLYKFVIPFNDLKSFLDEKEQQYNNPNFIETDPIQIPKMFSLKEDIEISGFLTSVIAWGQRKTIIANAKKMMDLMGSSPYDFVMSFTDKDLERFTNFVHRTFNGQDAKVFITALKRIYTRYNSLEEVIFLCSENGNLQKGISNFKRVFFEQSNSLRSFKHLSDPNKGSVAKRMNMYFRWMVRSDNKGVDLGIWKKISPKQLSCPLDVHSGNVARNLNLITHKYNDTKALKQLDTHLRLFDENDPVKYDFALFGLGIFEQFTKME